MVTFLLVFFLVAITPVCIATAYHVVQARRELGGRSAYYKKKQNYTGTPSWRKTLQLMRQTQHMQMDFSHFAAFWSFAVATVLLLVARWLY